MKFTNMALSLILVSSFFYSNLSCAGEFGFAFGNVGKLAAGASSVGLPSKDLMFFTIVGGNTPGACASKTNPHYVINNEDGGKTMVSLLLAAKMSGKKVHVVGRGTCNYIAGYEDVSLIYID